MTDLNPAKTILSNRKSVSADDLIPILQEIQEAYGYLPADGAAAGSASAPAYPPAACTGSSPSTPSSTSQPHGKHTVRCCRGTACHVRGGKKIINAVRGQLGIEDGETTADMLFSFETVACLGACALSPVMVVDNTYHGKMTPTDGRADPAAARPGGPVDDAFRQRAGFPQAPRGAQGRLDPDRKMVTICGGTGCTAFGSPSVREAFERELESAEAWAGRSP